MFDKVVEIILLYVLPVEVYSSLFFNSNFQSFLGFLFSFVAVESSSIQSSVIVFLLKFLFLRLKKYCWVVHDHCFRHIGISSAALFWEVNRELKQPRRQRQGERQLKNDFQIFQTSSRKFQLVQSV